MQLKVRVASPMARVYPVSHQQSLWLSIPFYNFSLTLTKAAIVALYLRIFTTPRFVLAGRIVIGVVTIYGLWTVISAFLNCLPVESFWDKSVPGRCIPTAFLWFFNGGLNIATDLVILGLPVPVLSHLRLPKRQKIGVMLIFLTGSLYVRTNSKTLDDTNCGIQRLRHQHGAPQLSHRGYAHQGPKS